jgi:hypothetical protein
MEADVPEAKFGVRPAKLRLPIGTQCERGMTASNGVFPKVIKGDRFLR